MRRLPKTQASSVSAEKVDTCRKPITFRGFKESPWTKAVRNAPRLNEYVDTPSPSDVVRSNPRCRNVVETTPAIDTGKTSPRPLLSLDESERQEGRLWDLERREWIERVQKRSSHHTRGRIVPKESHIARQLPSLAIESTGQIPQAFEFFKNVYAPVYSSSAGSGFKTYCQVALQDAMVFEQVMAYCLAMRHMDKKPNKRMTAASLYHSNRSVMRLRQRLQGTDAEDQTSDAVVMTIILLIAFYVVCGDFGPWGVHMKALRRITAARGGAGKLGWDGFLETKVAQIEAAWSTFATRKVVVAQAESDLAYPTHPFAPALCSQIAKLPKGFSELAVRKQLSLQFINVLEEVLHRMADAESPPSAVSVASIMDDVMTRPELTALQHVLAVAVLSCCIHGAQAREGVPPTAEMSRQLLAKYFPAGRGTYARNSIEENALDWAALVIRTTTRKDSAAWSWADLRVKSGGADLLLTSRRNELQHKFLEIPS